MKNKILTAISTIMLFVPWTILPLRTFDWALESPVAEIMVYSYAAFMIFSGIFSILSYTKGKVKSKLMQVCVVINSIYAVGAIAIIGMNIVTRIGGCNHFFLTLIKPVKLRRAGINRQLVSYSKLTSFIPF